MYRPNGTSWPRWTPISLAPKAVVMNSSTCPGWAMRPCTGVTRSMSKYRPVLLAAKFTSLPRARSGAPSVFRGRAHTPTQLSTALHPGQASDGGRHFGGVVGGGRVADAVSRKRDIGGVRGGQEVRVGRLGPAPRHHRGHGDAPYQPDQQDKAERTRPTAGRRLLSAGSGRPPLPVPGRAGHLAPSPKFGH